MGTSKLFKKVPVTVPGRSGFNMSHNNFFSAPVGTLVPNLVDFLLPGDEVDLSSKSHIQLPPMATDFYGRVEYKEEAFFVPCRILFGGWKDFYVNPVDGTTNPSNIDGQLAKYLIGANVGSEIFTASRRFTDARGLYAGLPVPNKGIMMPVGTVNSDGSVSLDFQEYLEWYAAAVASVNDGTNSQADICEAVRDSFLGYVVSKFIETLAAAIENRDLDLFWPDRPSLFSANVGPGSLADYLGFKVELMNQTITDDYLISVMQTIYDRLVAIYNDDSYGSGENSLVDVFSIIATTGDYNDESLQILQLTDDSDADSFSYLALSPIITGNTSNIKINNILPFMAYHKIYDDWYRAPMIQQSLFKRNVANQSTATTVANMPWITSGAQAKIYFTDEQLLFANGHSLFDLHQRNWQKDYFTSATPEPQAGDASSVKFDIVNDSGEFTIASLRAANALQQWLDRNNIGGFRYGDMIYAQYGVYPSDATTDRAIYLGSSSVEVYNKSVFQHDGNGGENTNNPFNAIGSKYASPSGVGEGNFCNNYSVTEAGFLIKIGSLVPQAYYGTGVRRMFNYNDISDIAFPVLAGVGDQPIYGRELTDVYSGVGDDTVFGYQQRYAEYKFIDDQVHGLLRDGQSLASFALQRTFSSVPELGSSFLEIPRDYLDQVSATDYKLSQYGCWVNCYNDYRKSSKLPAYSIPTLEDMKGYTVLVDKGGKYLA